MIYTFGNSHSHLFTGSSPATFGVGETQNKYFTSVSLGPTIAYNFYENHYDNLLKWVNNLNVNKDHDYIMLIVGEVDCRVHLPHQINFQNRPIDEVVKECIDRFFRVYLDLKNKGYNVIGWGGHPSTTSGPSENPSEPIVGDCHYRNTISLAWNDYLELLCVNNNIPYITIIKDLIDDGYLTKMDYFMDYCHLNHNKVKGMVKDKFSNIGILVYE
jgi:hypothetical protein